MNTPTPRSRCYAIVTDTWRPQANGAANTLGRLADGLLDAGHHLQLVRPAQPGEAAGLSETGLQQQLLIKGVPIPGYTPLQFGLPAYDRLLAYWRDQRPDSLYLATEGPLGWSALRAARRLGIPLISGFHTNFQPYIKQYRLGLFSSPLTAYLRWFHNQTLATLSASSTQQQELSDMGITNARLLGRGVDCETFHPGFRDAQLRRRWGARDDDIVLLHVGRLATEKNLPLLQRSWQHAQQHHLGDTRVRMVVVGDGPQREMLQQQLPDAVFTGMLTGADLATAYASADVFLYPSLTDTFGNVVIEAMAAGLAVVAFDTAAAHQHIRDRYSGCLAVPGNETQFLENLVWLLEDGERRRSMRLHARHRACQLDWPAVLRRFEGYLDGHHAPSTVMPAVVPGK